MAETENTATDPGIVFPCRCQGCRGVTVQWGRIHYGIDALAAELVGNYFRAESRRFWRSRVLRVRQLDNGGGAVVESFSATPDHTVRKYRTVVFCRHGFMVGRFPDSIEQCHSTAQAARKWATSAAADDMAAICQCHGCQIDRGQA